MRDPAVCRFEFLADIGKAWEKVDYAIMRDGRPSILMEAKSASVNLSNETTPSQPQHYFMFEKGDFAAFTNGVIWQWCMGGNDGTLLETPVLVHDVRSPGASAAELGWLRSISEPYFDSKNPREQAENASISSSIPNWIEDTRQQPDDDLLKLIVRNRKLGFAYPKLVDKVRQSFAATFEAYINRQTHRLLALARDQQREDPRPTSEETGIASTEDEGPAVVDLGDGGVLSRRESHERAWRVKGGPWQRQRSGRDLMLSGSAISLR